MKSLKTLLGMIILSLALYAPAWAQTRGINYQAVARDAGNNLLANQNLTVKFYVREETDGGTIVYQESHNATTNEYGLFNLVIGAGTPVAGNFVNIDWNSERHFLEVEVDGQSLGVQEMQSVPYSQVATSMSIEDLVDVDAATASMNDVLQWDGTEWRSATLNIPDPIWTESSNNAAFSGDIRFGGGSTDYDATSEHLIIRARSDFWYLGATNEAAASNTDFFVSKNTAPDGTLHITNGGNVGIGTTNPVSKLTVDGQFRGLYAGNDRYLFSAGTGTGSGRIYGPNSTNIRFTVLGSNSDRGFVTVYDEDDDEMASMFAGAGNAGVFRTRGPNGTFNFAVFTHSSSDNRGYMALYDAGGNQQAGMFVNGSAQGVVFADQKNFRIPHPEQADKEIWYCSLEGPEAAAYARGTGQLVNGQATINFPDHFRLVANPTTLTVVLTPLSGQSKGLAVITKTVNGFEVEELFAGQGNYEFDWEVKGVRKGHENYRVIRDASEMSNASMLGQPAKEDQ